MIFGMDFPFHMKQIGGKSVVVFALAFQDFQG